jgi:signal transduction histidine kinase
MIAWSRLYRGRLGAEIAVAFVVGAVAFVAVAAISTVTRDRWPAAVLGFVLVLAVLVVAYVGGVVYAVPVGLASIVAFDWYVLPPRHSLATPDVTSVAVLAVFILTAVLVGEVGAATRRRADDSEQARGVLADEQAALRRVATLVASQPSPAEVFAAVTNEVGQLFPVDMAAMHVYEDGTARTVAGWSEWGPMVPAGTRLSLDGESVVALVFRTRAPARMDSYDGATGSTADVSRGLGLRTTVGAPIVVDGQLWGAMVAASRSLETLPAGMEMRLEAFTNLIATAVSNAEARDRLERVAAQQAALRRVATLVAGGLPPTTVFAEVVAQVGALFAAPYVGLLRAEADRTVTLVAASDPYTADVGLNWSQDDGLLSRVLRECVPGRIEDAEIPAPPGARGPGLEVSSLVRVPIVVDGRPWGSVSVASAAGQPRLPVDTAERLAGFSALVATAISNTVAREEVRRLAEEQAALRRAATLVAQGAAPADVFAAVAEQIAAVSRVGIGFVARFEPDATMTIVAYHGPPQSVMRIGSNWPLDGDSVVARVFRTGLPARIDDYRDASGSIVDALRAGRKVTLATAGAPIVVDDALWGVAAASAFEPDRLPANAELRIADFADIVATSISNAEARAEVRRLADEQASLRRVATLVAQGLAPADIFAAVADEFARVFDVDAGFIARFEPDDTATMVATSGSFYDERAPLGSSWPLDDDTVRARVFRTGAPARTDETLPEGATKSTVGAPIVIGEKVWGVAAATSLHPDGLPADTEARLGNFADLIATAVSNAATRTELTASRARVVAAADEARRKLERDLHDGIQQQLVSLALDIRWAETVVPPESDELKRHLSAVEAGLTEALDDLRELSRGIHPAVLSEGGLEPALNVLARRSVVPIELQVNLDSRLDPGVEVAAYYVASEALANAVKHAEASSVELRVARREGHLDLWIRDDGVGGADPVRGSGLIGLTDRVEALGGTITIASPPGAGTSLQVRLPVGS